MVMPRSSMWCVMKVNPSTLYCDKGQLEEKHGGDSSA